MLLQLQVDFTVIYNNKQLCIGNLFERLGWLDRKDELTFYTDHAIIIKGNEQITTNATPARPAITAASLL